MSADPSSGPSRLSFVLPIPRYDLAESDEPLMDQILRRGHRLHVICPWELETAYEFRARGCEVTIVRNPNLPPEDRDVLRGWRARIAGRILDLAEVLRLYMLALDVVRPGTLVITHSNDAMLFRPFIECARQRGGRVIFVQMAFLYADVKERATANMREAWEALPLSGRVVLRLRARAVEFLTGIHVRVGPKRIWGTDADLCFMADESQVRSHVEAGLPADRFRALGVPFLEMIWKRRSDFDDSRRREFLRGIPVDPGRRTLLVLTRDPRSLVPGADLDRRAFLAQFMATVCRSVPDWNVVFKLHPVERTEDYSSARADSGADVAIIRDANIVWALLASDAMVSLCFTSPCYYARELGVPQVILRLEGSTLNDGHLPNFAGSRIVYGWPSLRAAIEDMVAKECGSERKPLSERDVARGASGRIVQEIERWVGGASG